MNDRLRHDLRHWMTALQGALGAGDVPLARRIAEQMAALLREPRVAVVSLNNTAALLCGPGIRVELAEPDVLVRAGPAALGRVLLNLVVNARQAGGSVTLRVGRDGTVAVEDTGPGMPPGVLARIFEPGFTTRAASGGSGLGLAIVRELAEAAGGAVTIQSVVGHGTVVTVRWPSVPSLPPPSSWPGLTMGAAATVLLVEDEPIVRQLAERALRQAGWGVVAVDSAEDALEAVQTLTPDAVVADLTLPGMDGRAFIAALRVRWPKLPAVLVSGYADSAVSADLTAEKVVFLAKPYTLASLAAAVKAAVRD